MHRVASQAVDLLAQFRLNQLAGRNWIGINLSNVMQLIESKSSSRMQHVWFDSMRQLTWTCFFQASSSSINSQEQTCRKDWRWKIRQVQLVDGKAHKDQLLNSCFKSRHHSIETNHFKTKRLRLLFPLSGSNTLLQAWDCIFKLSFHARRRRRHNDKIKLLSTGRDTHEVVRLVLKNWHPA